MPKIVTAKGKKFTFNDDVTNEEISRTIDEYFGVKKKEVSQPVVQKPQSVSKSKPITTPILSATEETQAPMESDGSDGKPKMKIFTGFTPEEQKTLQAKPAIKIPKSSELTFKRLKLQNELSKIKVTPQNQDEVSRKTDELSSIIFEQDVIEMNRLSEIENQFKQAKNEDAVKLEADKRLDDLLTNTGVWNNIKSNSLNIYNELIDQAASITDEPGIKELKADIDPLSEEKKEVKKDAASKKVKLSDEQINELAKQLYKDKQIDYIETDNINSFLDNLNEDDKNLLKQSRIQTAEHLQESNLKEEKVINAYEVIGNKKIKEYKNLESQILNYKKSGMEIPKELANSYTSLAQEIIGIGSNIQKRQSIINKNKSDLGTAKQEFDLLKRQYGDVENFIMNVGLTARELAVNTIGGLDYFATLGGTIGDKDTNLSVQKDVMESNADINEQRSYLRKSIESVESPEGFLNYVSDVVSNQIPNLVAASTGYGGLAVIGVSGTGQKYANMNKEVLEGKASYTPLQMASAPLLYGAAEVVSEIPTLSILKKGGRVFESIAKNEGDLIKRSAKQRAKEWSKEWSVDMSKELAGEEFTNFAQNFNDKFVLGKKDVGLLDNTGTVFKDTFTLTSILKVSPHVAGAILKPLQTNKDLNILDENSRKIIEFSKQLNNDKLTDVEKSVINKQINKATVENSIIMANTIDNIGNMPDDVYKNIIDLNNKVADIKMQAVAINEGNLPNKTELIKSLESDYRAAQTERNSLIDAKYEPTEEVVTEKPKIDEATLKRTELKKNLTSDERFSLQQANKFENAKVGDEFNFEEYKDGEFKSYDTKVKEIVDGKLVFENGKNQDDIKSYSNLTAEDAWFAKNYPELTLEKPKVEEDIDLTLPENKDNIIVSESSNGFILIDSNTKKPVEVFNEKAGENSGVSKPYATQEEAQARIVELKQPTNEIVLDIDAAEKRIAESKQTKVKPVEVISPETSSNYANLTENKDGDFVFFHVGGKGYDKIKKSTGGTIATSKEEAGALSKVGGIAMYYTKPDDSETMVRGEAKYAVTIPKEKVYDANTDPNNYAEQAKVLHEEENPGKAFDANTKAAYITKIAGENGYDMVVSEWMGKTRAQTTKEFSPTDVELKEGSTIVKPFEEQYAGNIQKGFKAIVPESKEAKFKAVYDQINAEKNKVGEYDTLYGLASKEISKINQDEVTKLVEEDTTLSQETKDMYAEALAYEPEQRRTVNVVGETVEVKNAPEGHHLNIGLLEGRTNKRMSTDDILSKLPKDVKVISSSEVEGTEPTISLEMSRPLTSTEMIKLLGDTKQQAIAQLSDKKGILYDVKRGTKDGWGEFNPEYFVTQDGKNLTEVKPTVAKSKLEAFKAKYINNPVYDRTKLDTQVENAKKSLSKILPNVKFVVHDTKESFIGIAGKSGRGYYDPATKTIHINALEANARTVAHEVFHSVLLDKVKTDANARDLTKRMISSIAKTLEGNPDLKKNLDDFIKNYDENIQSEEKVAELFGYLAEGYEGFNAPTKSVIKRAMDRLAKMFGLKPFTEGEIVDMLKTLSGKVATGEEIVSKDIKAISEGASSYIDEPTNIERFQKTNEQKVVVGDHKLSFVKKSDLIDIDSLMKDITSKNQKVWFWVADQLGRGNYFDSKIDGEHYLDAGPSFALDPINRDNNVIWASGKNEKEINNLIGKSDYIFIISGSPQKSKLFNKSIIDIVAKRAGDFNKFKKDVLESSKIKSINDILSSINSWDELKDSVKRKEFLLAVQDQKDKNTPLKQTLDKYNSIVDLNEIRDGFYADNNFGLNDIMLVLKPTGFGGKSNHSTYENNILGEVVGVPDIKVNAFDIMPSDIKNKYKEDLGRSQQQQAVAPYGIGVKQIERFQESEDYSDMKDIINDMINDGMSITEIKKTITSELGADQVSLAERAYNELTTVKEEVVATNDVEAFRDKVKELPQSGIVGKYLSGETIEKVEGEAPRNAQETEVMSLIDAGMHGKETVAMAKEVYGDKYVEKTLEFLDAANLKPHEKAVLYVSLENEMFDRVNAEPDNVGLKKLQDLVRAKSQQFLRESSLAINAGRLRAIMKDGFNYESVTDKFLSSDQLRDKKAVEKAIQSDTNAIQKEYESIVAESDLEQMILSGVEKQVNEIYKKLPTARRVKADKAIAALEKIQNKLRGKAYDATIGVPIALIDSSITIIKNSIKAGVSIADAIEIGINHIKERYGNNWANEDMFRKDMTEGFKTEGITEKEIKAKELSNKEVVKQALIDAGFGKEITVRTKQGKVKRDVLDWKKLAGEEGSVDKIRENVEGIIGKEAAKELEDEYNNLRASIIEKSLNELENRNTPRKKVDLKTSAKKLAELYNYGLFEKESDTYDRLMNSALGMNELDQKSFDEAKNLAKSLSELFSQEDGNGNKLSQEYLKYAERSINKKIETLLSKIAWSQSNGAYKAVVVAKEFIGLAQRNALVSVAQAIENTTSGYISRAFKKIGFMFDNVDTKAMKDSRNKLAKMTFKDITMNAGLEFGDVTSPFITKSKTMDLIVNANDSRLYHALTSTALGKPFLESADSMHKAALAQGFFHYNLIKILRKKGMSKTEAKNYVSENLTGQSFEDALITSKEIINKINENAGKKVISDSKESIYRFANDLVNEALVQGNKITLEELEASLKSADTVAGFELGHEPNNIISKPLNLFNSWVQTRTDRAVKDKKWNDAAALTAASIVTTNILNPYVGGGTNWTLLAAQKAGIPTLSTIYWNIKSRGSKLDLSTEEGMKNLEKDLKYQLLAKNANARMFIGAAVTLAAFALAKSTGADDDLYEWLKKNAWANKYMKKMNPPAVQFMLAQKDKKLGEFLGQQMNIKADAFDEGKKLQQAMKNAASGKTQKALGGAGQLVGSRLSTPIIPWRVVRDVRDIYRGLNGLPAVKYDYKSSGFGSGYFQGGMIEQLGMRPENVSDVNGNRGSSGNRMSSGDRGSSGNRSQSGKR